MPRRNHTMRVLVVAMALSFAGGCGKGGKESPGTAPSGTGGAGATGGTGAGGGGGQMGEGPPPPFEALPPAIAARKVKQVMTGLPLSADEQTALAKDLGALPAHIDRWMLTKEWRGRMQGFFTQAFQQTQVSALDYFDVVGEKVTAWKEEQEHFVRAAEESFARTVIQLLEEGRPFTETLTTDRFMLNPPLMAVLAFIDAAPRDDAGPVLVDQSWVLRKFPKLTVTRQVTLDAAGVPQVTPFEASINPKSPSFMKFSDATPLKELGRRCMTGVETSIKANALGEVLNYMFGQASDCGRSPSQFSDADWKSWRMVKIRRPAQGEERTLYWNLPALRPERTTELVLATPRVGFMTTLAFLANWPTNESNSFRVTTNQALIVGLGRGLDDRAVTVQVNETTSEDMHVQPGTVCYGCHQLLDPMRDFYRQSYSLFYSTRYDREDPKKGIPAQGKFSVDGSPVVMGQGIETLARSMAQHPAFAPAWTQKLCSFANSSPCDENDPELRRVAEVFAKSHFDWKTLVRTLFSSPLVTHQAKTSDTSEVVMSITRQEVLCSALEGRLGLVNPCNLRGESTLRQMVKQKVMNLTYGVPGSGYVRGDGTPLMPHNPNLFFHSATENICVQLATALVDSGAQARWTSANRDAALGDFVAVVMGLPSTDPRAATARAVLERNHAASLAGGGSAKDALQSTFTLACSSPFALSVGL